MNIYNTQIIETPVSIEVKHYSEPIYYDFSTSKYGTYRRRFSELSGPEKVISIKRREKYYQNKRHEIKRLVDCNFDQNTKFLTLTQAPGSIIQDDIDIGNLEFQKFVKRLKRWLKTNRKNWSLKYIATWERHQNGKIHYHIILFSFPYIRAKEMERLWSHGFIKINKINHVGRKQTGLYVSKYFAKELAFKDAKKKAYFKSRNLKRPLESKFDICSDQFDITWFGTPEYHNNYTLVRKANGVYSESVVDYFLIPKIQQ